MPILTLKPKMWKIIEKVLDWNGWTFHLYCSYKFIRTHRFIDLLHQILGRCQILLLFFFFLFLTLLSIGYSFLPNSVFDWSFWHLPDGQLHAFHCWFGDCEQKWAIPLHFQQSIEWRIQEGISGSAAKDTIHRVHQSVRVCVPSGTHVCKWREFWIFHLQFEILAAPSSVDRRPNYLIQNTF